MGWPFSPKWTIYCETYGILLKNTKKLHNTHNIYSYVFCMENKEYNIKYIVGCWDVLKHTINSHNCMENYVQTDVINSNFKKKMFIHMGLQKKIRKILLGRWEMNK